MASTILLTGANSSLGIPTVDYLLKHHPESSLVLTVRDAGDQDPNTKTLRAVIAVYPEARVSIRELDLTNLDAVRKLARSMKQDVASGAIPPLSAIVGNAYFWNLVRPMEMTGDGYEKTMQVSYLSHVALVLVLITSFLPQGGRIVLFSSDGHESGKNPLEKFPPKIPSDPNQLDLLVKPAPDATNDVTGHGFHRYANSKLATVMFTHALNRRLQRDSQLKHITAIVMNPGNLFDSRALVVNTPLKLILLSKLVLRPMGKIFGIKLDPTGRSAATAAVDVARLALNEQNPGETGYFTLGNPDSGSKDSQDEVVQEALWLKTVEWTGLTSEDSLRVK